MIIMTKWYVSKHDNGKFFDGWYGADANIHDDEQIHTLEDAPYDEGYCELICVGEGEKPTPEQAMGSLVEQGYFSLGENE